ncbi:Chlorophyllide a oxygenase, chloroplastic [Auxenochlorella protothecoides]|nr:Chlorophyllide a oxygenase, chloroplastic [Auxenochlorella protothecoides]KFM28134.1 Chlorophyllide a oxygenase, chloroplastic [Auxenochlorella protothecoides]
MVSCVTWSPRRSTPGRLPGGPNRTRIYVASSAEHEQFQDPENQLRRYGARYGKPYLLQSIVDTAPRVRVRKARDRARDQLADLAVMNERLMHGDDARAAAIRQRLDYLRRRRLAWEMVYDVVIRDDALCTLSVIEEANSRVQRILSEEHRERAGVASLRRQMVELQGEVASARARLDATQEALARNMAAMERLRVEAEALQGLVAGGNLVKRRRGLKSSLFLEPGLKEHWYGVAFCSQLQPGSTLSFELFGEMWELRRQDGGVPCTEVDGFVWVWPGSQAPTPPPTASAVPLGFRCHAEIEVEVPVEHGLLLENLLDLAHAPFTHTSTFAKGWPIPDVVKFQATKLLTGNWQPYPITMSFAPPNMVVSLIGLSRPGVVERGLSAESCKRHLHQLHVCLPSRPGHTRLLYRMSMDFAGWLRFVPGIAAFWRSIAGQVLGEDLVLVRGQQDRMLRGADTWQTPVSYDKLAVRYRRWRNRLEGGELDREVVAQAAAALAMSAGEMFALSEERCGDDNGTCVAE